MRSTGSRGVSRRAAIVAGSAFILAGAAPGRRPPRVLFVCLHGTVKSPIAREILRQRARERNIAVNARSRGIEPAEGASPEVAAALLHDGIRVKREPPRGLAAADADWADLVVYFDPLPFEPGGRKARDWRDTPSVKQDYPSAMAAIRSRVEALLDELAQRR